MLAVTVRLEAAAAFATEALARPKSISFAPTLRQHDVAGLQIAVDHAAAMRFIESLADVDGVSQDLIDGQRPFAQAIGQGLALQVFHHQVIGAILVADVVERADVGMIHGRDRPRFLVEALFGLRIFG